MSLKLSSKLLVTALVLSNIASGSYLAYQWKQKKTSNPAAPAARKQAPDTAGVATETYRKVSVRAALLEKQNEIETCYEEFLRTEPEKPEGALTLHWMINGEGQVNSPRVAATDFSEEEINDCVLEKVGHISFAPPPSQKETLVAHKFTFRRRSPAQIEFR